jgi:hypothetical protein
MLRPFAATLAFLAGSFFVQADAPPRSGLETRTVTLRTASVPISKALAEVARQTGVTVADDRGGPDVEVPLDLDRASFWRAVDATAARAKAKAVLTRDGGVSLVRAPAGERRLPTSYDGEFRVRVTRVSASRDLDTGRGSTTLTLEVVWTPGLRPLFLDSQPHGLRLIDGRGGAVSVEDQGSSLVAVEDRSSLTLDLSLPGLPRREADIGLLEGRLLAVVPSKFLTFRFDADLPTLEGAVAGGAVRRLVQEDVVCRIDRVVLGKERWTVQVGLEYPPGGRALESFQAGSLVAHNELRLTSPDGKRTLAPSGYVINRVSSRRAQVSYHFTDKPGARRGPAAGWKVSYVAPARIVEVPVRFRFEKVPLP